MLIMAVLLDFFTDRPDKSKYRQSSRQHPWVGSRSYMLSSRSCNVTVFTFDCLRLSVARVESTPFSSVLAVFPKATV